MRVAALRRIDRWLGVPVCLALTGARRVAGERHARGTPSRVLFVKLAEQGTTVLARPAFAAAAARLGAENVFALVFEENREILDLLGVIPPRNVLTVPGSGALAAAAGCLRAVAAARRLGIDAVVDLEFFARSTAALSWLCGASRRVGLHGGPGAGPWRGDLLTHRVLYQPDLHTAQLFGTLVAALDRDGDSLPTLPQPPPPRPSWEEPTFRPDPEDLARAAVLLGPPAAAAERLPGLCLLNANAGDLEPLRRWPAERYAELARRLLAGGADRLVLFTGSPAEAPAAEDLARRVGSARCRSVAGQTSLRDLLTLFSLCGILVTNDSGPGHFAALTGTPALVLFGPESPRRFGPLSPRARALHAGLACSPCLSAHNNRSSSCRDNACMQAIAVEEVAAAAEELLAP